MFTKAWQEKAGKVGGRKLGYQKPGLEPTRHPKLRDLAWAAGVWEGEGSIQLTHSNYKRLDGGVTASKTVNVTISQKDRELCDRMRDLFGGSVTELEGKTPKGVITKYHHWYVSGSRAVGFILTIYAFLTERRKKQVKAALDEWKAA